MRIVALSLLVSLTGFACNSGSRSSIAQTNNPEASTLAIIDTSGLSEAVFAGGCFWCVEGVFESAIGVAEAISGYAGGNTENPTYQAVGTGKTGHAEAVLVYYDSTIINFPTLLKVFVASTDVTQVNGQGPDHGTAYRTVLFYKNQTERQQINALIEKLNKGGEYSKPLAIEVQALKVFWPAEDYHQDYIQHNPNNPYVQHESIPRIKRFQRKYPELVKPEKNILK